MTGYLKKTAKDSKLVVLALAVSCLISNPLGADTPMAFTWKIQETNKISYRYLQTAEIKPQRNILDTNPTDQFPEYVQEHHIVTLTRDSTTDFQIQQELLTLRHLRSLKSLLPDQNETAEDYGDFDGTAIAREQNRFRIDKHGENKSKCTMPKKCNIGPLPAVLMRLPAGAIVESRLPQYFTSSQSEDTPFLCIPSLESLMSLKLDSRHTKLRIEVTDTTIRDNGDEIATMIYEMTDAIHFAPYEGNEPEFLAMTNDEREMTTWMSATAPKNDLCQYRGVHQFNISKGFIEAAKGLVHQGTSYRDDVDLSKSEPLYQVILLPTDIPITSEAAALVQSDLYDFPTNSTKPNETELIEQSSDPIIISAFVENASFSKDIDALKQSDLETEPDFPRSYHVLKAGEGVVVTLRGFFEGDPSMIDDEQYEFITLYFPQFLNVGEPTARFTEKDMLGFWSSGSSVWHSFGRHGVLTKGDVRATRQNQDELKIDLDLVFTSFDNFHGANAGDFISSYLPPRKFKKSLLAVSKNLREISR